MEDMFDRFFGQPIRPVINSTTLPVDITEREGNLFVKAAVPGVDPGDLQITIENNVLSISGETRHQSETENEKIYRREVSYGTFSRSIRLPEKLELDQIEATFNNGMVTVRIPRQAEVKPKVLKVDVKNISTRAITESAPAPDNA
jgi:HSP20 family protein